MINGVDYNYYWTHPNEYPRMKINDICNDGALALAEALLTEVREYYETTAKGLHKDSSNSAIDSANQLIKILRGDTIDGLTFGRGNAVANEFLRLCPCSLLRMNSKGEIFLGNSWSEDEEVARKEQAGHARAVTMLFGKPTTVENARERLCYAP